MKRKKNRLIALLKWPGKFFNTQMRLAFGLSCMVLSLVLVAEAFELIPNPNKPTMKARQLQTETLALTGKAIAESTGSFEPFERSLKQTLIRCPELRSIGLRLADNTLLFDVGSHSENWEMPKDRKSNDKFMFVSMNGNGFEGQLELSYEPLISVSGWLTSDAAKLAGFLLVASFLFFNIILRRTLKQLDPRSGAVPRRVRDALDNLAEGLLILDKNDEIMLANSTFGTLVGIENPDQLEGKNVDTYPWQAESLPWHEARANLKPATSFNIRICDMQGITRTFNVSASPVMGEKGGDCRGVMVTFDDITILEEHRQELIVARREADEANEAKSVFLSRMSHEIRTPMNAIIGYTDILRQGDTDKNEQQKFLGTIHSSGEHLLSLINDILDLSKIEAGQMTIENRQSPLVPILNQVIETLKIRAQQGQITLATEIDGKIPETILTDETRLRQVLINTVGNAIKFTKQGGVLLVVRFTDGMMEFDVVDSGVGIPEHALGKIFQPFSQADDSVTRKFGGTGLGLAISKQLSESMGGGISVTSEVNVGTVFKIKIDPGPLDDVNWITQDDVAKLTNKKQSDVVEARKFESGHILIVDDGMANRDLAGVMLRRLGLTFDKAENGQEALDQIESNQYDVVLMDINMPVMDGLTATKLLRQRGSTLPVIALTAMVIDEEKQRCLDNGCTGFLPKPIRLNSLIEALSPHLNLNKDFKDEVTELIEEPSSSGEIVTPTSTEPISASAPVEPIFAENELDGVEESLARTLAELGIDEIELTPVVSQSAGELIVPAVVRCAISLDDPEIRAIFDGFVSRLKERFDEFDAAWETKDTAVMKDLAHWLAGASGTVGLMDFVAPAKELENSDWSDLQRVEDLLLHLYKLFDRIEGAPTISFG